MTSKLNRSGLLNGLLLSGLIVWLAMNMPTQLQQNYLFFAAGFVAVVSIIGALLTAKKAPKLVSKAVINSAMCMGRPTLVFDSMGEIQAVNSSAQQRLDSINKKYGEKLFDHVLNAKSQWMNKAQAEISIKTQTEKYIFSVSAVIEKKVITGYWMAMRVEPRVVLPVPTPNATPKVRPISDAHALPNYATRERTAELEGA
ncbi:MAG: hypothetical protein HWE20_08120 [Gammaproteobacteria bacterium]|nr:hypothetical protein [Gammaproteobacteria bacterium]